MPTIEQHYVHVAEPQKLDALAQLLEAHSSPGEASLVFVRTKIARRRAGRASPGARLRRRGHAGRHEPDAARNCDPPPAQRTGRARRGHRRGGARAGRRAHRAWWSTTTCPTTPRATSTASAAPPAPGAPARPCSSSRRASSACCSEIERFTRPRIEPMADAHPADVAARRDRSCSRTDPARVRSRSEDLDLYLTLVQELAEESGHDLAEIAAGAAGWPGRQAADGSIETRAAGVEAATEEGMVRLLSDAGRRAACVRRTSSAPSPTRPAFPAA